MRQRDLDRAADGQAGARARAVSSTPRAGTRVGIRRTNVSGRSGVVMLLRPSVIRTAAYITVGLAAHAEAQQEVLCVGGTSNSCPYHNDNECDDGSGGGPAYCPPGTDCVDCGTSVVDCAALAAATLELPVCEGAAGAGRLAQGLVTCDSSCSEEWLQAEALCSGKHAAEFEAAAPAMATACSQTAAAILATAPRSISVMGLACHEGANALFSLQTTPRDGRPQYRTADGSYHLYWTPKLFNTAQWIIDDNTDDSDADIGLNSAAATPPIGSAVWYEFCNHKFSMKRVQLGEGPTRDTSDCATALVAVAPRLTNTCCRTAVPPCVADDVPSSCSQDCASLWAPYVAQCGEDWLSASNLLPASVASFFDDKCGKAIVGLTVLSKTAVVQVSQTHHFAFEGQSGTRYDVDLRVGQGSGRSSLCTANGYDDFHGEGACDRLIASGTRTCADFCDRCGVEAHICDRTCGVMCPEDGLRVTLLYILPPGAPLQLDYAIATDLTMANDKGFAFTAAATGTFHALVQSHDGSGPATVTVAAVGTALELSPILRGDGTPHLIRNTCTMTDCGFVYDSADVQTADGSGFDLVLHDADAGHAYAVLVELPAGLTAAQVTATFYMPGAAAGAAGFTPVVSGPLGRWAATPQGHKSYAEFYGCTDERPTCVYDVGIPTSYGFHPGGVFSSYLQGTWVAPSSGPVLLRLTINCDVLFFDDVQADGCYIHDDDTFGCQQSSVGLYNNVCGTEVRLTVTADAYYDTEGHRRRIQQSGDNLHHTEDTHPLPIHGTAQRTDVIAISRVDIEHKAAEKWQATPTNDRTLSAPPTLDQMLVTDTPANELLRSMYTAQQQPHVLYPVAFARNAACDEGHRRLQLGADYLHVTVETHAPSPEEADRAEERLISRIPSATVCGSGGKGRRLQQGDWERSTSDTHVCGLGSTEGGCTVAGQTRRRTSLAMSRHDIEALAADTFETTPVAARKMASPPTLDEMIVSGTPANALLSSVFVQEQHPHVSVPVDFSVQNPKHSGSTTCEEHRRLQMAGDVLHITLDTHAATPTQAAGAVHALVGAVDGGIICSETSKG